LVPATATKVEDAVASQPAKTIQKKRKKPTSILGELDQEIKTILHDKKLGQDEKLSRYTGLMNTYQKTVDSVKHPPLKTSVKTRQLASLIQAKNNVTWNSKYELLGNNGIPIKDSNINKLVSAFATSTKPVTLLGADLLMEKLLDSNGSGINPSLVPSLPGKARKPSRRKKVEKRKRQLQSDNFDIKKWNF
jgi:hypothetical protein